MLVLAHNVDHYLGTENGMEPNVQMLTAMFFFLNFLAATQVHENSHNAAEGERQIIC